MTSFPLQAAEFKKFTERVLATPEIEEVTRRCGLNVRDASQLLATYANEASVGFELIAPLLHPHMRVLEIGCGIGILAHFLLESGVEITGIEPGASGFGFMPEIASAISRATGRHDTQWLGIGAEQLDPSAHGPFGLIYSTNVLEHIPDLDGAFRGMASVLAPAGTMVHLCPNYTLPFEPHFGIPLIPFFPRATACLYPQTIKKLPGIWEELNFITARRVKRLASAGGLTVSFDQGILAAAMRRFDRDALFRERQGWLAGKVQLTARALGLLGLLEKLPAELASPMVMRLRHDPDAGAPSPVSLASAKGSAR